MRRTKLLKNSASYTASTESIHVVANNIKGIRIAFDCLGTGTTAATLANLIAHSSAVKLTVGGEVITLVRHDDLFVLNFIFDLWELGIQPTWLLTTTADNTYGWLRTYLPILLTTDKEVYVNLDYTGVTDTDTGVLDLQVDYGDKAYSRRPIMLRYVSVTATTNFTEHDMSVAGKTLIGLLVFGTTIPVTTTKTFSVAELKILVKRDEKAHMHWYTMDNVEADVEDTVLWVILENYRFFDCRDEPISADDLKVAIKSVTATDAVRLIGIYQ